MSPDPPKPFHCDTLAIVGVGLIGGAVARDARQSRAAKRILGLGRDTARLQAARHAGLIDEGSTDPRNLEAADVVVVCTPVDRIVADVRSLAPIVKPAALLTDAGSVKGAICKNLADIPNFIGSHPLAGSEKRGFEHADDVLLKGRTCVVTPTVPTPSPLVDAATGFWSTLGMNVVQLSPDDHDAALARTSHFPHLAAYALAGLLREGDIRFAASGFRDATRIAGSDPELWTAILSMNRNAVQKTLHEFRQSLDQLEDLLAASNSSGLRDVLEESQQKRLKLDPPTQ